MYNDDDDDDDNNNNNNYKIEIKVNVLQTGQIIKCNNLFLFFFY